MSYCPAPRGLGQLGTTDDELASRAGIPVGVLRAIRQVESGANPSVIRFEPHLFLRERPGAPIPFTHGPVMAASRVRSETDRAAFERARAIDENLAIRSTSWGTYQVLGAHLLHLFPSNPVSSFYADPRGVSDRLLVRWFETRPSAAAAARALNFSDLAYRYNGSRTSPWGARVAAAYARGGGEGGTAALATAATAVALPWIAAGGAGLIALAVISHYAGKRRAA